MGKNAGYMLTQRARQARKEEIQKRENQGAEKRKNCIDKEDMQDKVSENISLNAFNSRLRAFA